MVHKCGFKITAIISDNNRINQNLFNIISENGQYIWNPDFPGEKIFLLFDSVHIFKNIRNNWMNISGQEFVFPSFDNFDVVKVAKFQNIVSVYNLEKNQFTKKLLNLIIIHCSPTHWKDKMFDWWTIYSMKQRLLP